MNRELVSVQLTIQQLRDQCDQSVLSELAVYEMRLIELTEKDTKFGSTDERRAHRNETYHSFLEAFNRHGLERYISRAELDEYVDRKEQFDQLQDKDKENYYLNQLADHMQSQLRNQRAYDLMYVPLNALYLRYGESKTGRGTPSRAKRTNLVNRIVDANDPLLVIRGLPGTGKSVAMRQVARAVALKPGRSDHKLVPIFIALGQFGHITAKDNDALLWLLSEHLRRTYSKNHLLSVSMMFVSSRLPDLLRSHRCMLIFDGMDELPRDGYDDTCRALLSFAQHWTEVKGNRFLFSCREFDYPKELRIHSLVILPFDLADVESYLRTHLPAPELENRRLEVRQLWHGSNQARSMLDNPFFLHLATRHMIEHPSDPIPANRGPLFDAYVELVLREDQTNSKDILQLLEELALWLTDTKVSGTTALWSNLEQSQYGSELAGRIKRAQSLRGFPYFLEPSSEGVTFRHHRVRELFSARALRQKLAARGGLTNDSSKEVMVREEYLDRITGDVWYFETLVMLASLLDATGTPVLLSHILGKVSDSTNTAYRALLAAECLEASTLRFSRQLGARVFERLKECIISDQTGVVEKAECWHAISRLQLSDSDLRELPTMVTGDNRFLREEAVATIARTTADYLPGCRPIVMRLVGDALRLVAFDRLLRYRTWIFTKPIFTIGLGAAYLISLISSFLVWLASPPLTFALMLVLFRPVFFWWLLPSTATAFAIVIEAFFWFNEDKRSPKSVFTAVRVTIARLGYSRPTKPRIPVRKDPPRPKTNTYASGLKALDKWALIDLLASLDKSPDISKYLNEQGLLDRKASAHKALDNAALQSRFRAELPKLADLVDISCELGYKIPRDSVQELCSSIVRGTPPVFKSAAEDVIFGLRRVAREKDSLSYERYDQHAVVSDKSFYQHNVSDEEIHFLLQRFNAHNYNCILMANGLLPSEFMNFAEQNGEEAWLAATSRRVLNRVSRIAAASGHAVPRVALKRAFERICEGLVDSSRRKDITEAALGELTDERLRIVERLRALRSIAGGLVVVLLIGALAVAGIALYYNRSAKEYSAKATEQVRIAKEQEDATVARQRGLAVRDAARPPSKASEFKDLATFDQWSISDLARAISSSPDPQAWLREQSLVGSGPYEQFVAGSPRVRRLIHELKTFADLVSVSTELEYHVRRDAVYQLCTTVVSQNDTNLNAEKMYSVDLIFQMRRDARTAGLTGYRYDTRYNIEDRAKFVEEMLPGELTYLSGAWQAHGYLTILYANGVISSRAFERLEGSGQEDRFANIAREFLVKVGNSASAGSPVPRTIVTSTIERLAMSVGGKLSPQLNVETLQQEYANGVKRWLFAKKQQEDALRLSIQARQRAEEAEKAAHDARMKIMQLGLFLGLIVLPILCWLFVRYLRPRVELYALDASVPESVPRIMAIAVDPSRDMALRKTAVRKLALSDDVAAMATLSRIANLNESPEALSTEAHRALHEVNRRGLRRGV